MESDQTSLDCSPPHGPGDAGENGGGREQGEVLAVGQPSGSGVIHQQSADPGPLPEIFVVMKRLPETVEMAEQVLRDRNTPPVIFHRGGKLVKLTVDPLTGPAMVAINRSDLQCELACAARWLEATEKGVKPIYPPGLVTHELMRRSDHWAPGLRDVTRIPIFGKDWELLLRPGYYAADQILYHPDHLQLEPVVQRPTEEDVARARCMLCQVLFGEFPFVAESHRAAAVAAAILPFVRHRIDGATPLHAIDSSQPGTGKTLLADVICIAALGKEPPANTEIANGDDLRKWMTSTVLAGQPVVLLDNVNARLGGAALAAALTKIDWADRILGTSQLARGTINCLWLATGNNLTMTTELARRIVHCRLDAGLMRPFLRRGFAHPDLRSWAKSHRGELIWAILTLVQNWVARGQPMSDRVLGSYENYCRILGGILQSAGVEGFLQDLQSDQSRGDEFNIEWMAFIAAWRDRFGAQRVSTGDLDKEVLALNPEMLGLTLLTTASERGRRVKIGQELRKRRDAVMGEWRIRVSDTVDRHGCWHYWLDPVDNLGSHP
jgi:putative DNA primase/helicase